MTDLLLSPPYSKANRDQVYAELDASDEAYATQLRKLYVCIESNIKENFDQITENLMAEPRISRSHLLGAILDYEKKNNIKQEIAFTPAWCLFSDEAFNFCPRQGCWVS